ncbi:hypothetical protein SporoP32a_03820 [Sporosarcina ureae]|nr:hypothetical protein SporoP32a_03820 [Sporosarcina ureae]
MDQLERRDNQKRAQRTGWLTESPWESVRQLDLPSRTTHKLTHCSFALALALALAFKPTKKGSPLKYFDFRDIPN